MWRVNENLIIAMNIQHVTALIEMLSTLGFPAPAHRQLLFYACLGQKQFVVGARIYFGEDIMNYQVHFKEDNASRRLTCVYYDATLRKTVEIEASVINGVDVSELEKRMTSVNWQIPLEDSSSDNLQIADKTTWMKEAIIEEITRDLEIISATAEGAVIANTMKYKFWTEPLLQNTKLELHLIKSKYELSQRFYILNGDGITANEAYRFLNNRWLERSIHAGNRLLRKSEVVQKESDNITSDAGNKKKTRHSKKNT